MKYFSIKSCPVIDIDQGALDNCGQNLTLNGIDPSSVDLALREGFEANKKYPLVFANILEAILIEESQ